MITIITHSPYIISSFNNLLFANKVGKINDEGKRLVNNLIDEEYWIDPKHLTVNYLKDGFYKNMMSKGGVISESELTSVNEELSCKFDDILEQL
jgi:hypothetical protein